MAANHGLRAGQQLMAIDGRPVADHIETLQELKRAKRNGAAVELLFSVPRRLAENVDFSAVGPDGHPHKAGRFPDGAEDRGRRSVLPAWMTQHQASPGSPPGSPEWASSHDSASRGASPEWIESPEWVESPELPALGLDGRVDRLRPLLLARLAQQVSLSWPCGMAPQRTNRWAAIRRSATAARAQCWPT